jgi:hypothetical protein
MMDARAAQAIAASIHEVPISDELMARAFRFRGSPTIRIDGKDFAEELPESEAFGLNCRWYFGSHQTGLAPLEMIHGAMLPAGQGER